MAENPKKFGALLSKAVRTIAARYDKGIGIVQDELGYALGKQGGASIERWRKGYVPTSLDELVSLTRELVKRRGLEGQPEVEQFLAYGGHPNIKKVVGDIVQDNPDRNLLKMQELLPLDPFVVGLPINDPRQFFGRETELQYIFKGLRGFPLHNIGIIGRWRSGKTSLLRYVENITRTTSVNLRPGQRTDWLLEAERYEWVFVDFNDPIMRQQKSLLLYLLKGLKMLEPNSYDPEELDLEKFWDIVIGQELQQPTIILMDQIRLGMMVPELDMDFWNSLRSLVTHHAGGMLAFLVTSQQPLVQQARASGKESPFFNIFSTVALGPLTEEKAYELIASSPEAFSAADIEWILDQSGRCA